MGAVLDRIPVSGGRAVKELAQSVERTAGHVERRAKKGFFGRIVEAFTGKAQTHIDRRIVGDQREIVAELDLMRARGIAVDVDIARVAGHLRQLQHASDHYTGLALRNAADIAELGQLTSHLGVLLGACQERLHAHDVLLGEHAAVLGQHATILAAHSWALVEHGDRLDALEARMQLTEFRHAAGEAFTVTTERWVDGETYADLPWVVQVLLLAQEVAAGPCGAYELLAARRSGGPGGVAFPVGAPVDPEWFRLRLVKTIMKNVGPVCGWEGQRPFVDIVLAAVGELASVDDRMMVSEILGVGLAPQFAPPDRGSVSSAFALALDQVVQSGDERPERSLVARVVSHVTGSRWMPSQLTAKAFVERAVAEQASSTLAARVRLRGPGQAPQSSVAGPGATG
jgi:hypothetical protein